MTSSKQVLIVEDESGIAEMLSQAVRAAGYRVLVAEDGDRALRLASSEIPDAIVLDIMLPKLDGWEVCRRLKSDGRTSAIPIVIYSTLSSARDSEKGRHLGAAKFISKERDLMDVIQSLRELTGGSK